MTTPCRDPADDHHDRIWHRMKRFWWLPSGRRFAGKKLLPTLRAGSRSVAGNYRAQNEDRCFANPGTGVFVVADGVGGYCGGSLASQIAVETISARLAQAAQSAVCSPSSMQRAVELSIQSARERMLAEAESDPRFCQMAATLVLAVVVDQTLYVSHVGDCRAYLLHQGRLSRLTTDQTFVQMAIDTGLLTRITARTHPWRHLVTNTVGIKPLDQPAQVQNFALHGEDRVLLTSDGLTDVVEDDQLRELLQRHSGPQATANALVDCALENGSRDNITGVVIDVVLVDQKQHDRVNQPALASGEPEFSAA